MKGYLANGLFNIGDRYVNEQLAKALREAYPELDLYVPQENGEINDKSQFASSRMIARADKSKVVESDFLVACLDGVEIDSGVSAEVGIMSMLDRPMFGLMTDIRQFGRDNQKKIDALVEDATENQFIYRNLMVVGLVKDSPYGGIYSSIEDLVEAFTKWVEETKA